MELCGRFRLLPGVHVFGDSIVGCGVAGLVRMEVSRRCARTHWVRRAREFLWSFFDSPTNEQHRQNVIHQREWISYEEPFQFKAQYPKADAATISVPPDYPSLQTHLSLCPPAIIRSGALLTFEIEEHVRLVVLPHLRHQLRVHVLCIDFLLPYHQLHVPFIYIIARFSSHAASGSKSKRLH